MATPSTRNLVLLLTSGHTVRIALREDDLTNTSANGHINVDKTDRFIDALPAVTISPFTGNSRLPGRDNILMAYIEDPSLPEFLPGATMEREPINEFQRITVEGPGTAVQYG